MNLVAYYIYLLSDSIIIVDTVAIFLILSRSTCFCLRLDVSFQLMTDLRLKSMSLPKTICDGVACSVLWCEALIAHAIEERIL